MKDGQGNGRILGKAHSQSFSSFFFLSFIEQECWNAYIQITSQSEGRRSSLVPTPERSAYGSPAPAET
jgi:hypothetical protein